jgi:hypothetical protein
MADTAVERAYVKRWAETGRALEALRWTELAALDEESALRASEALLDLALAVPLPRDRWCGSGLAILQDRLHRRV